MGIAIDEGAIESVDDPITDYLPELIARDARFGDITIVHLLDMTSGIRYEENGFISGDDTLTYYFDALRARRRSVWPASASFKPDQPAQPRQRR